jgi:hypothetical protein
VLLAALLASVVAVGPTDTVLRFPLTTSTIEPTSVGDSFSDIWMHVAPDSGAELFPRAALRFTIPLGHPAADSIVRGIVKDTAASAWVIVVDWNANGRIEDDSALTLPRPSDGARWSTSPRVIVGGPTNRQAIRLALSSTGKLDWRPDDRFHTTLRLGGGEIGLRLYPMQGLEQVLAFLDHDNNGSYDQHLSADAVLPIGGYRWMWRIEPSAREIVLTRTAAEPVMAGYRAPDASVASLAAADSSALLVQGKHTLLIFCHPACPGCRLAIPAVDAMLQQVTTDRQLRVVVIADAEGDARAYQQGNRTSVDLVFGHAAWKAYAVMPTPTFVEVDAAGTIRWRAEGWSDEIRKKIDGLIRRQ